MASKDPMDRLFTVAKINNLLKEYKRFHDFDAMDKKLIRGIYMRKTQMDDRMTI